ncbi:MAG TPA: hypothetical protein VN923_09470, partial [Thermoanaerobaculia bacterium]|nr:hypothetical protein [Thermoanaerobaculia bacterium]
IVQQVPTVVNQESLEQYVAAFPAQARREVPGAKITVREQGLKPIAGVPSLRLVIDLESPVVTMRTLHYLIPGGSETAALTYSATAETFDQYLPIFEAAAQKTEGAAEAPMTAKVGQKLLATGVSADDWQKIFSVGGKWIGALLGLGVVLLASRLAKRKKAKAAG